MKRSVALLVIAAFVIVVYSCRKTSNSNPNPTPAKQASVKLDLPSTTDVYFEGQPSSAPMNKMATLGRVLFYDQRLSINNAISCGSCHKQAIGFADNTQFSRGFQGANTARNSPGITELKQNQSLFWDGRENTLTGLVMRPITNHVEMGMEDASVLPAKLGAAPYYSALFKDAFGDNTITLDRISQAVAMFLQAIGPSTNKTRFDLYKEGNLSVFTAQEVNGMNLFDNKYNCKNCHGGNNGSYSGNQSFRDIGLDATYADKGRGTITGSTMDNGTFLVPNLRNVALTAPYMHDGRYATLEDVVDHYSTNIQPSPNLDRLLRDDNGQPKQFNITPDDKAAIVAFLNTLTDYTTATDPKFSNPFKQN